MKDVGSPEEAELAIAHLNKFNGQAVADAETILKAKFPDHKFEVAKDDATAAPASAPVADPNADPAKGDLANTDATQMAAIIKAQVTEVLQPVLDENNVLKGRIETMEKMGVGRHSDLPDGGGQENISKASGPVQFVKG